MVKVLLYYVLSAVLMLIVHSSIDRSFLPVIIGDQKHDSAGQVWPRPKHQLIGNTVFSIKIAQFHFKVPNGECAILQRAITRCRENIDILEKIALRRAGLHRYKYYTPQFINELVVDLTGSCEDHDYPYLGMDESYLLHVNENSTLRAKSIWGIIQGLETFSQLCYLMDSERNVAIRATEINDSPHYQHRGLLIDTGRHYIPEENIKMTINAMGMNKMNVLHWHIVDDQSFPYQSEKFPELSEKGAYYPTLIYTKKNIEQIINHARDRGIRVVPEFDVPGHTLSWGKSHPEFLTVCNGLFGPMSPIKTGLYNFLHIFFEEVRQLFPDKALHIGGDEVNTDCWTRNAEIKEYMKKNNITDLKQLSVIFYKELNKRLHPDVHPIVWEESFIREKVPITQKTVVQLWRGGEDSMAEVLNSGYKGIMSGPYYLDHLNDGVSQFYKYEPRLKVSSRVKNITLLKNLIGGEACMWGEMVDATNALSRTWPRASAVAEVLWSVTQGKIPDDFAKRIDEHVCRMMRRGIPAQPALGPGFCVL